MSDFISLSCPSCGGSLALTSDADRFACPYCLREHLVRRSDGHVSLVPIIAKLERVEQRVEQHASELAIHRLRKEREKVQGRIKQQMNHISDWNRVRTDGQSDFARLRTRSVVAVVFALLTGGLAVAVFVTDNALPAEAGLLSLAVSVIAWLVAAVTLFEARRRAGRVANAAELLRELYRQVKELKAQLARLEAELEHHTGVVRGA